MTFLKNKKLFILTLAIAILVIVAVAFFVIQKRGGLNIPFVATKIEECTTQDCLSKFLNQNSTEADCAKVNADILGLRDNCYLNLSIVSNNEVDCKKISDKGVVSQCEANKALKAEIAELPDTLFDKKWDRNYCNSLPMDKMQLITNCNQIINDHYTSELPIVINAVKSNSLEKCNEIKNEKVFSLCNEIVKGFSLNNSTPCSGIIYSEVEIGNVCQWVQNRIKVVDPIIETAVKTENASLCETIKGKNSYYDSHECVFEVIIVSLKDVCGQLKSSDLRNNCYVTLALQKKDASYCENAGNLKEACKSLVK
jgi:YHS domain-containing protein